MRQTLLAFWMSCLGVTAASVSYQVTQGASACREERIPGWTKPKDFSVYGYDISRCRYDFRTSDGSQIYVGLSCMLENGSWKGSPEKYAFIPLTSRSAKRINETEWESGSLLRPIEAGWEQARRPEIGYVEFRGKRFPKTGSKWPGQRYLLSPDQRRIAILSWDGIVERGGSNILFGFISLDQQYSQRIMFSWFTHIHGKYWIDIYDVASATRSIQIQGEFHGVEPDNFQGRSLWVNEYFILPLDSHGMRRLLACEVVRLQSAKDPLPVRK